MKKEKIRYNILGTEADDVSLSIFAEKVLPLLYAKKTPIISQVFQAVLPKIGMPAIRAFERPHN